MPTDRARTASGRTCCRRRWRPGNIHIGTITGKLNGVMPATTPSGWRSEWLSTLVPTFSVISPLSSCGAPVANSTTSRPRVTSPMASSCTLPCSLVMMRGERLVVLLAELAELRHDAGAPQWRCRRPLRKRGLRRGDGLRDFFLARQRDARLQGAERGIEHIAEPAARARRHAGRRCSAGAFPG